MYKRQILQGVDFSVPQGGVTMLLGRNGAGKTTTLRTIMGLWQASQGSIRFDGASVEALPTPEISRAGVAYVPADRHRFGLILSFDLADNIVLTSYHRAPFSHGILRDDAAIQAEGERLVDFVAGIEVGAPVLVASYGDATAYLSEDALAALNSLGAALTMEEVRGQFFAIAGVKAAAPGTAAAPAA